MGDDYQRQVYQLNQMPENQVRAALRNARPAAPPPVPARSRADLIPRPAASRVRSRRPVPGAPPPPPPSSRRARPIAHARSPLPIARARSPPRPLVPLPRRTQVCADCPAHNPDWCSIKHGIFPVPQLQRPPPRLGVHVSFVRSATMDTWSIAQYNMMKHGGNAKMLKFFDKYGVAKHTQATQKYNNDVAAATGTSFKCAAEDREWKKPRWMKGASSSRSSAAAVERESSSRASRSSKQTSSEDNKPSSSKADRGGGLSKKEKHAPGRVRPRHGRGSLLKTAYRPEDDPASKDWRPPSPKPPRGAREGAFLMGLRPDQWVAHLKSLDRQDDRGPSQEDEPRRARAGGGVHERRADTRRANRLRRRRKFLRRRERERALDRGREPVR